MSCSRTQRSDAGEARARGSRSRARHSTTEPLLFVLSEYMYVKYLGTWANSADPDQTPQYAASDQSLYCLLTECSIEIWENIPHNCPIIENGFVLLLRLGKAIKWANS